MDPGQFEFETPGIEGEFKRGIHKVQKFIFRYVSRKYFYVLSFCANKLLCLTGLIDAASGRINSFMYQLSFSSALDNKFEKV